MHFTLYAGTWMSYPELNFCCVWVIEILICESRVSWRMLLWLMKSLESIVLARQTYSFRHKTKAAGHSKFSLMSLHCYLGIILCCITIHRKKKNIQHITINLTSTSLAFRCPLLKFYISNNTFQKLVNRTW